MALIDDIGLYDTGVPYMQLEGQWLNDTPEWVAAVAQNYTPTRIGVDYSKIANLPAGTIRPEDFDSIVLSNQDRGISAGEFSLLPPAVQAQARANPELFVRSVMNFRNGANQDLMSIGAEGGFGDYSTAQWAPGVGVVPDASKYLQVNDDDGWGGLLGSGLGIAFAPFTGGSSLLLGAIGGGLGSLATGGGFEDALKSAVMGGALGYGASSLGSALYGAGSAAGAGAGAAAAEGAAATGMLGSQVLIPPAALEGLTAAELSSLAANIGTSVEALTAAQAGLGSGMFVSPESLANWGGAPDGFWQTIADTTAEGGNMDWFSPDWLSQGTDTGGIGIGTPSGEGWWGTGGAIDNVGIGIPDTSGWWGTAGNVGGTTIGELSLWDKVSNALGTANQAKSAAGALNSLFGGDGKNTGLAQLLGTLGSTALGVYGSNSQADSYKEIANKYLAMGEPYRQRLAGLYANPDAFLSSKEVQTPVQLGTDALARSLSTQGNPVASGNALQQLQSYSADQLFGKLGQEKDRLAGFGGLSSYNAAAPQAETNAVGQKANVFNAVGAGMNNIFNPPQQESLADILKRAGY